MHVPKFNTNKLFRDKYKIKASTYSHFQQAHVLANLFKIFFHFSFQQFLSLPPLSDSSLFQSYPFHFPLTSKSTYTFVSKLL